MIVTKTYMILCIYVCCAVLVRLLIVHNLAIIFFDMFHIQCWVIRVDRQNVMYCNVMYCKSQPITNVETPGYAY